jgi:hypothetical protein
LGNAVFRVDAGAFDRAADETNYRVEMPEHRAGESTGDVRSRLNLFDDVAQFLAVLEQHGRALWEHLGQFLDREIAVETHRFCDLHRDRAAAVLERGDAQARRFLEIGRVVHLVEREDLHRLLLHLDMLEQLVVLGHQLLQDQFDIAKLPHDDLPRTWPLRPSSSCPAAFRTRSSPRSSARCC